MLQEHRTGTDGALHVHAGTRLAGRPITLDGVESEAWASRVDVVRLNAWAADVNARFSLLLRGVQRTVRFDHSRAPAFSATPLWLLEESEQAELLFRLTLNFVEI